MTGNVRKCTEDRKRNISSIDVKEMKTPRGHVKFYAYQVLGVSSAVSLVIGERVVKILWII